MQYLTKQRMKSFATLAASLITTINAALAVAGMNPLPFVADEAGTTVSIVLAFITTCYAWWKDNVITKGAAVGHDVTVREKAASKIAATTQGKHTTEAVSVAKTTQADNDALLVSPSSVGITAAELSSILTAWRSEIDDSNDQ